MNAHHDELERLLGRDLHRQVDGMVEVPFGLTDVKGRAGRIRRNRRIAAGVGVAAALVVIVPTALTTGGMLQGTQEIEPAPSPSRSQSPSPSPSPSPDVPAEVARTPLTLEGLPRGDAPAIEYFTPDGVVLPGEGTQELPVSYQALVPGTGDGWIALGPAKDEVVYLTEDFERDGFTPSGNAFVTSPDRDLVTWTVPLADKQTIFLRSTSDPSETMSWDLPAAPEVEPVGILGPDAVVYETRSQGETTSVGIANPDGSTTELPYARALAADPVNGLISVLTEGASGPCFGVVEAATRQLAWQRCDYALGSFSPDGRYVMATAAEADLLSMLYVLDARTGDPVAEFSSQGRRLVSLVGPSWESGDTIVASAGQGDTQTLVRLGVDGTLEEVADPVDGDMYGDHHYYLGDDRTVL